MILVSGMAWGQQTQTSSITLNIGGTTYDVLDNGIIQLQVFIPTSDLGGNPGAAGILASNRGAVATAGNGRAIPGSGGITFLVPGPGDYFLQTFRTGFLGRTEVAIRIDNCGNRVVEQPTLAQWEHVVIGAGFTHAAGGTYTRGNGDARSVYYEGDDAGWTVEGPGITRAEQFPATLAQVVTLVYRGL